MTTQQGESAEVPRLSYSIAHILKTKTPLHAFDQHRLLGGNGRRDTEAMDEGRLMEKFVLGCDLDKLTIVDADSWRGKEAQAQQQAAFLAGNQAVLRKHYDEALESSAVIIERFKALGIDLTRKSVEGKLEVYTQHRVEWADQNGVLCSGVIDRLELDLVRGYATIYDFKTTSDASTRKFTRSVWDFGYHIQANSYEEAVGVLFPQFVGRIKTVFLVAEKETPYACRALELAGSMHELGRRAWSEAKDTWKECLAKNEWPGYQVERIEATAWMLAESLGTDALKESDFEVVSQLGGMKS